MNAIVRGTVTGRPTGEVVLDVGPQVERTDTRAAFAGARGPLDQAPDTGPEFAASVGGLRPPDGADVVAGVAAALRREAAKLAAHVGTA